MKLERYKSYKNTGMDWIGEIPGHWKILRIKYLFKEINERSEDGEEALLSVSHYTGVTKKSESLKETDLLTNAETLEGYKKVNEGDLVSNIMLAWNGSLGMSPFTGIISPAYSVYRLFKEGNRAYFHYLFRSEIFKAEFKRNSSGVIESRLRLYTDDFFRISALVPPIEHQTRIAHFLDQKTAQIDKAIAQKERLIELLKERRQIMIHQAVTKGVVKEVKMKDSGVDWIGNVPEHWVKLRIGRVISKIEQGNSPQLENGSSDYHVLKLSAVKAGNFFKDEIKPIHSSNYDPNLQIEDGDLLITRGNTPELVADSCIIRDSIYKKIIFSDLIYRLKFDTDKVSTDFMLVVLQSSLLRRQIIEAARGSSSSMVKVSHSHIKSWFFFLPEIEEQSMISSIIKQYNEKYSEAIQMQSDQIIRLKEYRTTLIDAAVTGKIKVSE